MTFTLTRQSSALVFRAARLTERHWITPNYVRVTLAGTALQGFDSPGCNDHIRVFFPPADTRDPEVDLDLADTDTDTDTDALVERLRASPSREYTPVAWDPEAGALALEFLVHGEHGIAGRWAATAPIGSIVGIGGPRGSLVVTGAPDTWLLAGDETAIPAIRRFAERMPRHARGHILIESTSPAPDLANDLGLAPPPGVSLEFLDRTGRPAASALIERLASLGEAPGPNPFVFVAAEQSIVRAGRELARRWEAEEPIITGYWRAGDTEYHAPH